MPDPLRRGDEMDYSEPRRFDLKTQAPNKTIDIGKNGMSLSLDAQGRVLQASTYHAKYGMVMANNFEQFDGSKFFDVPYVRAYRTRMLQLIQEDRPGFGLNFDLSACMVSIQNTNPQIALYRTKLHNNVDLSIAVIVAEDGRFVQHVEVTNRSLECVGVPYTWSFYVSLNRASYGQLTEGGPIPLPASQNILEKSGRATLRAYNPHLDAQLIARLDVNGQPLDLQHIGAQDTCNAPLNVSVRNEISVPAGTTVQFCASFQLMANTKQHADFSGSGQFDLKSIHENVGHRWKHETLLATYILRRNVDYILYNCVIPVSDSLAAIIADHVALPLGWNRDNYWQFRLLLDTYANVTYLVDPTFERLYKENIQRTARGHINWVFTKAERPDGFWHRSYLTNGQPKDRSIFQLDQQCYPLLELCDYLECFPEEKNFVKGIVELGVIDKILDVLASKRDVSTELWPTDETPGDDAVVYPYHFSNHVLLWRTFTRLDTLFIGLGALPKDQRHRLDELAAQVKEKTIESFTTTHTSGVGKLFAYQTDANGKYFCYHDGNDIPTLRVYEWSFVSTADEVQTWHNTMKFGLSPANTKGYCNESPYDGLGSVHSSGTWTLGIFQALAYAASTNDTPAMQSAWTKMAAAMQWDGTFPEAVDPKTARCTSKAWFSWPSAMLGSFLIHLRKMECMEG